MLGRAGPAREAGFRDSGGPARAQRVAVLGVAVVKVQPRAPLVVPTLQFEKARRSEARQERERGSTQSHTLTHTRADDGARRTR
jgi:hypothetical protein